jgi:micrococcal nuclease
MLKTKLILIAVLTVGVISLVGFVASPQTQELFEKGEVLTESLLEEETEEEEEIVEEEVEEEPTPDSGQPTYLVLRVVDGDTIELDNGQKLRYIGIDTPETVDPRRGVQCFGREASNKNKELVEGKTVRLEKDVSETDRFGRLLRYVYVQTSQGEVFVNDLMVREGFALSSPFPPDISKQSRLDQAEAEARSAGRGLWGTC